MTDTHQFHQLRLSKYARCVSDGANCAIYHTLFGNMCRLVHVDDDIRVEQLCTSLGSTALDKYLLVLDGEDERNTTYATLLDRQAVDAQAGQLLTTLQLSVSQACQLRCPHCLVRHVNHRRDQAAAPVHMSPHTAIAAVHAALEFQRSHNKDSLTIIFFGGEPLEAYDTVRAVLNAFGCSCEGIRIEYKIATNGLLLREDIAEDFLRYGVTPVVSVDGLYEVHDRMRPHSQGGRPFQRVAEGIRLLSARSIATSVATLLTDNTFDSIDGEFIQFLSNLGVTSLELLLPFGPAATSLQKSFSAKTVATRLIHLHELGIEARLAVSGYWLDPYVVLSQKTVRRNGEFRSLPNRCTAAGAMISVEPDGTLFSCKACSRSVGSLSNFEGAFRSPGFDYYLKRAFSSHPSCNGCPIEGGCLGVCFGHYDSRGADIYQPDPYYCEVWTSVFDELVLRSLRDVQPTEDEHA